MPLPTSRGWSPSVQNLSHNSILMYQVGTFVNQIQYWGNVQYFWKFGVQRVKGQVHYMTIYGPNYSLGSIIPFKCIRCQLLAVLSISENLRVKVKVIRWPNMDKYAVLELSLCWNVPGENFRLTKTLIVAVLSISEQMRVKDQHHQMTKDGQNCSFAVIAPFKCTK